MIITVPLVIISIKKSEKKKVEFGNKNLRQYQNDRKIGWKKESIEMTNNKNQLTFDP